MSALATWLQERAAWQGVRLDLNGERENGLLLEDEDDGYGRGAIQAVVTRTRELTRS